MFQYLSASHSAAAAAAGLIYQQAGLPPPPGGGGGVMGTGAGDGGPGGVDLQAQLYQLEKYYRVQEDALQRQFDEQRRNLAHQYQAKLAEQRRAEFLEQQKALALEAEHKHAAEQQQHAAAALQGLKNKKSSEQSAIASNEVKQKLRECLLNKNTARNIPAAAGAPAGGAGATDGFKGSPPELRHWATQHSSLEQHSPPTTSGLSPPLRPAGHLLGRYDDGYGALRKTVSEPNLKMRSKILLRQKALGLKNSPLVQRRDIMGLKKKAPLSIDTSNSNPDSGPNSPPSGTSQGSQGSVDGPPGPMPPKEETPPAAFPLQMMSKMVINQSMPNISIGQPRGGGAGAGAGADNRPKDLSASASEAEIRATRMAAQHGLPLTQHMMSGPLPYYPAGLMDAADPLYIEAQMKALELARSTGQLPQMSPVAMPSPGVPYSVHGAMPPSHAAMNLAEAQQAAANLQRTHSAPLPLPGQLLLQHQLLLQQHKQREQQQQQEQKHYLKQKLASSIKLRAAAGGGGGQSGVAAATGSKSSSHMENVDEEAEARLAAEMRECREDDTVATEDPRVTRTADREAFVRRMRQRAIQPDSPPMLASSLSATVSPVTSASAAAAKLLFHANSSPAQFNLSLDSPPPCEGSDDSPTGLCYDMVMLRHACLCGSQTLHPEHPGRLHAIHGRLQDAGLIARCKRTRSRRATLDELQSCHSEAYTLLYGSNPQKLADPELDPHVFEPLIQRFCKLPCGGIGVDSDTAWNEATTPAAARVAAGCVIELAMQVATDQLRNGFAIVRPPGHHAEPTQAMGFCFFNSIAVATKQLLDKVGMKKILIVDWDVHHGNSTQQIFYADPRVLYISLHRHDNGNFFPGTGAPEECGIERGVGYNINVAFSGALNPPMGDAEYLTAFRTVVMPIARAFGPEIVLVSAGFDAAAGHPAPLGGYTVSPPCFGWMTSQLQTLAGGKLVLVLEGGYELTPICDAAEMCLRTLLGEEIPLMCDEELVRSPCPAAVETLALTIKTQAPYWPCVLRYSSSIHMSAVHAARAEDETVSAFASLSVVHEKPTSEAMEES